MFLGLGMPLTRQGRPPWTPARLFAQGQAGAWYDPSDLSTLFQDAAGTTHVASAGDPVGLMLDKREGLRREENLFEANGFVAPAWTDNGDGTYTKSPSTWGNLGCTGLTAGRMYEVSFRCITTVSSPQINIYRRNVDGASNDTVVTYQVEPGETYRAIIKVVNDSPSASDLWLDAYDFNGTVGDVFFREIPGNHGGQSVSASRYTWQSGLMDDDGVDDSMNVTLPAIASATVAIARPTGAEITYPVDLSSGSYTLDGDSYGWVIVDGQLSAAEQAQLTRWMNKRAEL